MLERKGPRIFTRRSPGEVLDLSRREINALSPDELWILEEAMKDEDLLNAIFDLEYEHVPVSPEHFLEDDFYYGEFGRDMFPALKRDFIELFENGYDELLLSGSQGWGKSFLGRACMIYTLYRMLCLRDPQRSYGLAKSSEIINAVVSLTIEHARRGVVKDIEVVVRTCPVFKEWFPCKPQKSGLYFPQKNIVVYPENYAAQRIIGLNVFSALIDEANAAKSGQSSRMAASADIRQAVSKARGLYETVMRRRKSRYMKDGRLPGIAIIISSATLQSSFTEEKIKEAAHNQSIFVRNYATWDVKGSDYTSKQFHVLVANGGKHCKILEGDEVAFYQEKERLDLAAGGHEDLHVLDIPIEWKQDFEKDLIGSLREIAGVSAEAVLHLLPDHRIIAASVDPTLPQGFTTTDWECGSQGGFIWERLCDRKKQRVEFGYEEMTWVPKVAPGVSRFIHIDTSINGDATGFCMGHMAGMKEIKRRDDNFVEYTEVAPLIHIDFLLRIVPPPGGDILFGTVRALIYELQSHGFSIDYVTLDGFQSEDTRQQLEGRGIKAEIQSVDRFDTAYVKLKAALLEKRVVRPEHAYLDWELQHLIHNRYARKVDHPMQSVDNRRPSKDVADALCGVVFGIEKYRPATRFLDSVPLLQGAPDRDDDESWVTGGRRVVAESGRGPLRRL